MFFISRYRRSGRLLNLGPNAEVPTEELSIEDRKPDKIEKLLRWRKTGRGQPHAYLVLWEGLPLEDATWESANYFEPQNLRRLLERDDPPEEIN